jgi:hypothetical protein
MCLPSPQKKKKKKKKKKNPKVHLVYVSLFNLDNNLD